MKKIVVTSALVAAGVASIGVVSAHAVSAPSNDPAVKKPTTHTVKHVSLKTRLAELVKKKDLTQAQANAIEAEHTAIVNQRKANPLKNMSPAERKAALKQEHTDVQAWAKQHAIPAKYEYLAFGVFHHHKRANHLT